MAEKRKIAGFKKFSDIKGKPGIEEVNLNSRPETDSDLPANPNTPEVADRHSIEKPISRKGLQPFEQDINLSSDDEGFDAKIEEEDAKNETKVETIGRIAKFPKNVNASKAYNFLENVKVSKKSIWYIMIEKQDHELQMVKYNYKEGVDLGKFVNELKSYYTKKYAGDAKMCEMIESINVDGNDKYSMIKNIPLVKVEGRKMIAIITEDLIKLLSK